MAIVPSLTSSLTSVAVLDSRTLNMTYLRTADGHALFKFNGTDRSVNSTFCSIASLEVFRGWNQVIEISHQGFILNCNGTIGVEISQYRLTIKILNSLRDYRSTRMS